MQADADADAETLLAKAQQAIEAGEWSAAKAAFEAVLESEESDEVLFGLGRRVVVAR